MLLVAKVKPIAILVRTLIEIDALLPGHLSWQSWIDEKNPVVPGFKLYIIIVSTFSTGVW